MRYKKFFIFLAVLFSLFSIVHASSDPVFNESFDSLDLVEDNGGTAQNMVLDPGLLRRGLLMQGPGDNLLDNAGFETMNTYIEGFREWKKYVGSCGLENISFTEDTSTKYQGSRSAKVQYGCAYGAAYVSQVMGSSGRGNEARPAPAGTYRFTVYAKGTGDIIVGIQNGSHVNASAYALDSTWRQYNVSYSINSTVHLEPYISFSNGAVAWLDSAELTYDVSPTLSYATSGGFPNEGTIEFWLKPKWDGDERNKSHIFLSTNSLGPDGWGEFVIGKWWNKSAIAFKVFQWTDAEINTSGWAANEWHHVAFTWDEGTTRSYVDGLLASLGTYAPGAFSSTRFYLGSSSLGVNHSDALMDAFNMYDYAKTYGTEILPTRCGDGIWDTGENLTNCPEDCNEYCGEPPLDVAVLPTGDYVLAAYVMPGWQPTTVIPFQPDWEEEYDFTAWDDWVDEVETEPIVPGSDHPKEPLINYYDSNNPVAVDHMIKFGLEHGISLYVYNWYWYRGHEFLGECVNTFMGSKYISKYPDKIRFAVMFDTPYDYSYAGAEQDLLDAMEYSLQNYLSHPNYYKIGNKPVFFVYSVPHITQVLGEQGTADLFAGWDQMAVDAGHEGLILISLNHWGNLGGCADTSLGLEGDTYYAYLGDYQNYPTYEGIPYTSYDNWTTKHEAYWELLYDCPGSYVFPAISPGWDNTPSTIQNLGIVAVVNSTPEKYGLMAQSAKDFVDAKNLSPKIIITEAWDEWKEGAALAPTKRWGTGYLDALAGVFGENPLPMGELEVVDCDYISGWSCDENNYSEALSIHLYMDGPYPQGTAFEWTVANITREEAVGEECYGYRDHGFLIPTPSFLKDGVSHSIYAYAINTPQGDNPLLGNKTLLCSTPTSTTSSSTTSTSTTTITTSSTTSTSTSTTTTSTTYPGCIVMGCGSSCQQSCNTQYGSAFCSLSGLLECINSCPVCPTTTSTTSTSTTTITTSSTTSTSTSTTTTSTTTTSTTTSTSTSSSTTTASSTSSTTSTTSTSTTTTTSSSSTSTTSTTMGFCSLPGDYPPCGEVLLSEVVDAINQWIVSQISLSQVIDLINAWRLS